MVRAQHERGQGLVEFALVLPILILLLVSAGELGLIFGKVQSLGYASREGARTGSALVRGLGCGPGATDPKRDPSFVDPMIVATVQRILTSPDSGITPDKIQEIQIFRATSSGGVTPGTVSIWQHNPASPLLEYGLPVDVDPTVHDPLDPNDLPENHVDSIDYAPTTLSSIWRACDRQNDPPLSAIESIGVTVKYTYDFVTPLPALLGAISGGNPNLTLSQTTIMALNPTVK